MEESGICQQAFVPMRLEPDERSEMTSQVLYGETFTILERRTRLNYSLIRLDYDGYEGWIDSKSITVVSDDTREILNSGSAEITHDFITTLRPLRGSASLHIGCGSTLRLIDRKVIDLREEYIVSRNFTRPASTSGKRVLLVKYGMKLLGIPYLWGGRSSFGFDCSGFTQNLFRQVSVFIPRDSDLQSLTGRLIDFIDNAKPGDLAFFDNEAGRIVHVGIIISKNRILHASGKVRIDRIDHQGIYNADLQKYTHKLRVIKDTIGS